MSAPWWKRLLEERQGAPATSDAFTAARVASRPAAPQVARPKLRPLPQRPCQCSPKR